MPRTFIIARAAGLFVFLLVAHSLVGQTSRLAPKQKVGGVCTRSAPCSLAIEVPERMTARLEIDQPDADLEMTVISPNGVEREVDEFDFGREWVTISATLGGIYHVRLAPVRPSPSPVNFSASLESVHTTEASDGDRINAEDAATKSKRAARVAKRDWDEVLDLMRSSLHLWQQVEEADAIARTHLKMGDLYFSKGVWDSARIEYREAKNFCDATKYLRCYAEAANNIGLTALNLADLDEAQSELRAAGQAWKILHLPLIEAITNSNLGLLSWESGEWQSALDYYDVSRRLFRNRSALSYARTLNNVGLVYMSMTDYENASSYFSQALRIVRPLHDALPVEGRIRINLGRARMLTGKLDAAHRDQHFAASLMERNGDINGQAEALNNLGQVQLRRSRLHEARDALNHAFSLYQSIHDQSGLSSILHYQGVLASKEGDLGEAIQRFQLALKIRLERGLTDDAAESLYQLAVVERKRGQREQSRQHIREAIAETQALRANVTGEPLRRSYLAGRQKYSAFLIEGLLADRSRNEDDALVTEAFEACESSRARSLVDLLGEDRLSLAGADPALLTRLRSLERRLSFKTNQLAALSETPARSTVEAELRREIRELLTEDSEVESALQSQIPRYRDAVAPRIVTAGEVRGLLSENDLLLEYFLGEPRSFVWIINRHQIRVVELPPKNRIEHLARGVVTLMSELRSRESDPKKEAAFQLAKRRLAAAIHLSFDAHPGSVRTIVVPDAFLNRVSFAILPATFGERHANRALPLGLVSEVVQVPSATAFQILKERQRKAGRSESAAVFADPVFDDLDSRVKADESPASHSGENVRKPTGLPLARLSFSQLEVETAERLLPPTRRRIYRGFQATKSALFADQVATYSILLLSTHAFLDDRQPELSSVVLSMVEEKGHPVDGLVHLYELYQLKLNSLVILSACETATGREVSGEGLIGLSRGFLQAGAWGVLASPYRIDAEGSAFLINAFLNELLGPESLSPSQALLEARRALAGSRRWKDPYYWGSFVLVSGLS